MCSHATCTLAGLWVAFQPGLASPTFLGRILFAWNCVVELSQQRSLLPEKWIDIQGFGNFLELCCITLHRKLFTKIKSQAHALVPKIHGYKWGAEQRPTCKQIFGVFESFLFVNTGRCTVHASLPGFSNPDVSLLLRFLSTVFKTSGIINEGKETRKYELAEKRKIQIWLQSQCQYIGWLLSSRK